MSVRLARAYDPPSGGHRVLVDRVWPRGRSREALAIDEWLPEVAPSAELRGWFGHEPARWEEFRVRYRRELEAPEQAARVRRLAELARSGDLVLVFGARDRERNQAVVLAEAIDDALRAG